MYRHIFLYLFLIVLIGCSDQDDELQPITQPDWTQKEFSINYGGLSRRYTLYKPKSYSENSPLLFMLHGFGSNMNNILAYSKMNDVADQNGFMICYPQGSMLATGQAHWNANLQMSTVNDIDFLEETLEDICWSGFRLISKPNKQEVVIVPKKSIKHGFFEKLFHLFR